jgi:hypothetical protein
MSALCAAREPEPGISKVHFDLYGNYLVVVRGTLGNLKKRNLVIDTGTNPTILDQKIAQQLNVEPITTSVHSINVVSGSVRSDLALLPNLELGPLHCRNLRVAVADLGSLHSQLGIRIDAVVGLDVLANSNFLIDYAKKELIFGPIDPDLAALPFSSNGPFVSVPVTIDDKAISVMVDTGTASLILFADHLGDWRHQLPPAGLNTTTDLGGRAGLPLVRITRTRMGSAEFGPRNAYIAAGSGCCGFDGVMGITAARVKRIGFDFEKRQLSWQLQDRAIPTMSESVPPSCPTAWVPGFTPPAQASAGFLDEGDSCNPGPRPHARAKLP